MIKKIIYFFFFNSFFEKKIKNAYEILEKNKKIELVYKIKEKLKNLRYYENQTENSFKKYDLDIFLALNQFIYSRFINTSFFTSKLIFALAYGENFYFPIPKKYLDIINLSVKVSFFKSKLLFILCLVVLAIYQFFLIIINILFFFKPKVHFENKIFLNSIPNLHSNNESSYKNLDFYKWAIKKFKIDNNLIFFHCNKLIDNKNIKLTHFEYKTNYIQNPIIPFFKLRYIGIFFKSILKTFKLFFKIIIFKKVELLLLIKDFFYFYYLESLPKNQFYNFCLFNNSDMVFRPLWTYVNEKNNKGSVIMYFYSTNMMPLLQEINKNNYYEIYGYCLHSWSNYLTWNKNQKNWLEKEIKKNVSFIEESTIPFSGKHLSLEKKNKTLTIFDVPPKRTGIYYLLHNPYNIYTLEYCEKFLNDIINSIPENYYSYTDVIIKLKKDYDNIHPDYRRLINKFTDKKKIQLIKDISPESVIEISDATISVPFTSPAITSFYKKKETIYYDPSGQLSKDNCLEKQISLISSKESLESWVLNILNK